MPSCPRCGAEAPEESRFCANCGFELEVRSGDTAIEPLPPDETGHVPVSVVRAEPGLLRALTTALGAMRGSALGREAARATDRARAGVGIARASLSARSRAQRELVGLRRRLRESQQRRDALLRDLGDAVYREDGEATESLKAEVGSLDRSMEETRHEMHAILEHADASVRRAQLESQPTLIQPPEHPDVPEPYPPPGELDPPLPPDIPEPAPERGTKQQ